MRKHAYWPLGIALSLFCIVFAARLSAEEASDPAVQKIETFYAALTGVMKDGPKLGLKGRYDQLVPIIRQTFDIPDMTRLSVGPAWTMMGDADHMAIMTAFERMTVANYAKNFSKFAGERFTVQPMAQTRNSDKIVESTLITSDHASVPFDYRMHDSGDGWKIEDVYLNGYVSQLAVRRSDFAATVASSGATGLVKKIDALSDTIMTGG